MANNIVRFYHLRLQYPAPLYSTFTLREMEFAIQFSCDRKNNYFRSVHMAQTNPRATCKRNYVSAYPVLSRKPVRPDIKERYRYHSGNTLCGRTAPLHSSAPPHTPASCTHDTHRPSSGGIPSARNSGKEEKKQQQPSQVFGWVSRL